MQTPLARIFEAEDAHSIARGMQGLLVRVAKALNREWGRCGRVLVERDHARVRRAPRERFDPAAAGNRAGPCATVSPGGRSGPPSSGAR